MEHVGSMLADFNADIAVIWPFLVTFGMLLACGLGFPIPEELPVVLAGLWVGSEDALALGPARWLILPVCILGVVVGDGFLYGIGRYYGPRLFEMRLFQRLFPPDKRARVEKNFHRYGVNILLFARLLPGIRGPIFITAGIMKLPFKRFLLADGLYAIPGVSLLFFLSWWFGTTFADLVKAFDEKVDHIRPLILIVFLTAVVGYMLYNFFRKPVVEGDPKELPLIGGPVARVMEGNSKDNVPALDANGTPPASNLTPPKEPAADRTQPQ